FFIYLFNNLNIPVNIQQAARIFMTSVYLIVLLGLFFYFRKKVSAKFLIIIGSILCLLIIQLIVKHKLPHFSVYFLVIFLIFYYFYLSEREIIHFLNITFLVYFIFSFILFLFPTLPFINYEYHSYPNRFIPWVTRFLGIEGSPAAIDAYAFLLLIVNVRYLKKNPDPVLLLTTLISIITILWTSSLSPLFAITLAFIFSYFLYRYSIISISLVSFLPVISIYLYRMMGMDMKWFWVEFTQRRIQIWDAMFTEFQNKSILEKLFGVIDPIQVESYAGITNNPHNFALFTLFIAGIIFSILVFVVLVISVRKIINKPDLLIIYFILFSSYTNRYIISLYNPVFIIALLYYINSKRTEPHRNIL
ncbi:MAG: hypothetical protein AMS27_13835, partial [Bacteroides sp. SM23_62_1]